jgi:DNA-directed RNA polymerase specialized sigma24 family protein
MTREVNWSALSPRAQFTLQKIAIPLSHGYSQREIAEQLGKSQQWVMARVRELRAEIERASVEGDTDT